ncbi:MAG: response regulator [Pseudomonadota bacterium]
MVQRKLLVVDDELNIRMLFEKRFTKSGYEVSLAKDAEEALAILKWDNIPVMFLDINMPGMNGLELCQAIRKEKPIAIIYAMTGYSSLFELSDCLEAGFDDYFLKPVDLDLLDKAAQQAFEKLDRWKNPQ